MILSERDLGRLDKVHPDLRLVVIEAANNASDESFVITEGLRTYDRQRELFLSGKSKTMNSRHLRGADGFSKAVDLAAWYDRDEDKVVDANEISWKFPDYQKLAVLMKDAAAKVGVPIEWGGDWTSFKDGPHFQLPHKEYP